jgi:hypothetical protein
MKRFTTDYFRWGFMLFLNLILSATLALAIRWGLTYQKKYSLDLSGYSITLVGLTLLGLSIWETITLIDFIVKDVKGQVIISNRELKIVKHKHEAIFCLKDLQRIEFGMERNGSRSITSSLTFCKLVFKNKEIVLTSFTVRQNEIQKLLINKSPIAVSMPRQFFSLI